MIQIGLYVAAGFLTATLIALLTLPFVASRAAESATRKLRAKLPFSTAEMNAEKDALRAEFAVNLRKVEMDLAKQSEKVANQNIELRVINEKLAGATKVGKASKLALEEMRSKEHELNERLRARDAQYAGLEQRTRQMLRENRELKLTLRKHEEAVGDREGTTLLIEKKAAPTVSKSGLPVADISLANDEEAIVSLEELRKALDEAKKRNRAAEKQIAALQEKLATARLKPAIDPAKNNSRLPKAAVPEELGGDTEPEPNKAEPKGAPDYPDIREQLLDFAANLTAVTAALEGNNSKIKQIIADTSAKSEGSLAERMNALLAETKSTENVTRKTVAQLSTTAKPKAITRAQGTQSSTQKSKAEPKPKARSSSASSDRKKPSPKSAKLPSAEGLTLPTKSVAKKQSNRQAVGSPAKSTSKPDRSEASTKEA